MDSIAEISKSKEEMQLEIEALQKEVMTSRDAMHRTQACFHQHQAKANFLTTSLQAQLRHKDQELRRLALKQERQVEKIVSHLLFLEGQIRKDQKNVVNVLLEKDKKIKSQQAEINDLKDKNNKLVAALKELHMPQGTNGITPEKHYEKSDGEGQNIKTPRDKDKLHKLRFSGMRDRLRRHRSSFELHHPEPLETLEESTVRSCSQENLADEDKDAKVERRMNVPGKERPRSMIEMPRRTNEYPLLELEFDLTHDYEDEVYDKIDDDDIFANGSEEPADIPKSYSLPQDLSRIANGNHSEVKERPHSMSSVDTYALDKMSKSPGHKQQNHKPHHQQHQQHHMNSPNESNPFKSIKTMLKRKGSKLRKKRSVSLPQGTNQEYAEALKKHFEKYDLS
ncbi:ERC protein 2-like [Haliotis asinina]|uniref:ERC protein 2-like n=1 Tax=Haliotis asinina TaxID=109174 RepID=UPI003531CCF2